MQLRVPKSVGVLLVLVVSFAAAYLDFEDCGSVYWVDKLDIDGCSEDVECEFYIGDNKKVSFEILAAQVTSIMTKDVYLLIRGQKFTYFDVVPDNPCSIIPCPVKVNLNTTYSTTLTVADDKVPVRGDLVWTFAGDNSAQLVCFSLQVSIVYSPVTQLKFD